MESLKTVVMSEICGIFAGDGTLYKTNRSFVLEVRGGKDEKLYYENVVKTLFGTAFDKKLTVLKRCYNGGYTLGIRICGNFVMNIFHNSFGFPIGKKSNIVEVPNFVLKSNDLEIWAGYLRGVFDTDGSIYLKKTGKGNKYRQPVISFTSVSHIHLLQIKELLDRMGFNCWIEKTNFRVRLCGWSTIERFLKLVKPNNQRHWTRIKQKMPRLYAEIA
ncbi:MAG: LAGLIDADG family homing endonuclease [Candidatus Aenigmatarchaeota archaeon]